MLNSQFCIGEITDNLNPLQNEAVVLYFIDANAYKEK